MASAEHLELSDFIKSIHQNLRHEARKLGVEDAWKQHCTKEQDLNKYAHAMHDLAIKHWSKNTSTTSRNDWTYNYCKTYFFEKELQKQRLKECEILTKIKGKNTAPLWTKLDKLKLLDVGSCYNPFKQYDIFEVTPIDIAPATTEVLKCDFTNLQLAPNTVIINNKIQSLTPEIFDVIVFSLLLEYLPSPNLRMTCCEKAYNLLRFEGVLIIITPDSNHVGHNAQLMKSWRYILAQMGFSRIKYEKHPHLHCMAFRKALSPQVTQRWVDLHKNGQKYDQLFIPQDDIGK